MNYACMSRTMPIRSGIVAEMFAIFTHKQVFHCASLFCSLALIRPHMAIIATSFKTASNVHGLCRRWQQNLLLGAQMTIVLIASNQILVLLCFARQNAICMLRRFAVSNLWYQTQGVLIQKYVPSIYSVNAISWADYPFQPQQANLSMSR